MSFSTYCKTIVSAILFVSLSQSTTLASDNSPSIWAQDTVDIMKQYRGSMYARNADMYQHQTYFDNPVNCLNPVPPSQYLQGTTCPRSNVLATYAASDVDATWKALASAMFPVTFGLPDTASQPRASLSDFSHYYNELNTEIQSLLNSTQYFICRYKITSPSALHTSVRSTFVNHNYDLVREGPEPFVTHNGTENEYPYYGRFRLSFINSVASTQATLEDTLELMEQPTAEFTATRCGERMAAGIGKPVFPDS